MKIIVNTWDFHRFYDELSAILTDYEQGEQTTGEDLYCFLVKLQLLMLDVEWE